MSITPHQYCSAICSCDISYCSAIYACDISYCYAIYACDISLLAAGCLQLLHIGRHFLLTPAAGCYYCCTLPATAYQGAQFNVYAENMPLPANHASSGQST